MVVVDSLKRTENPFRSKTCREGNMYTCHAVGGDLEGADDSDRSFESMLHFD